jgi:ABC-2 type transport system ATP-binding protein
MYELSTIIEVNNLTKIYGKNIHLGSKYFKHGVVGAKNVSFSVQKGEIFGFLGPNGAGKTTVMRAILDYLKIQEGSVSVFGFDHHKDAIEIRKKIGYVPGDMDLFENLTGEEFIEYFGKFRSIDPEFFTDLKKSFRVNLSKKIKSLSKGNRQQVGLIAAFAPKPDLLILDEPTSGLDPLMTANLHRLLRSMRDEGLTIFLSSHDLAEVQAICNRVGIIKNGEMILIEEVEELREKFLQNVTIKFHADDLPSEDALKTIDSVISVKKINSNTFSLKLHKNVNHLFKFLVNYQIEHFSCEDASLEEIFLQFYK